MDVGAFFVANSQPSELVQPSEGSFDDPSPSAQSTAVLRISLGEPGHNAAGTQTFPDCLCIVTPVAQHAIRTTARTPSPSLQGWDGINECERLLRIITIRPSELNC
jgi:hypothetical protein